MGHTYNHLVLKGVITMGFYRTVVRRTPGLGVTKVDFIELERKQKEKREAALESARLSKELDEIKSRKEKEEQTQYVGYRSYLKSFQAHVSNKLHKAMPEMVLQECFNYIYSKSLVHDPYFVHENRHRIHNMGVMYIHKLGGMNGLKKAISKTNSPFLMEMYQFAENYGRDLALEKFNKTNKQDIDEEELREIIDPTLTEDQRDDIHAKMDRMGADELANIVSNKVVDVVRDEQQREKDLADTEKHMVSDMKGEDEETESEDSPVVTDELDGTEEEQEMPDDVANDKNTATDTETPEEPKDATTKESFALLEHYNPLTKRFDYDKSKPNRTFFYSLMCGITNRIIRESTMESTTATQKNEFIPKVVLESPLNINVFDTYIQDKNEDLYDLSKMDMADRAVIASTSQLDKDFILSEALLQYTLFETAYTMKLIDVNSAMIQQQSNFLMK